MEDIYVINIDSQIYEKITSGKCCYMALVNDKARQSYSVGNKLSFVCGENTINVTVSDLLYFENVSDLINMIGKEKCGYPASASVSKIEDSIYTDKIEKYGLVAVKFNID